MRILYPKRIFHFCFYFYDPNMLNHLVYGIFVVFLGFTIVEVKSECFDMEVYAKEVNESSVVSKWWFGMITKKCEDVPEGEEKNTCIKKRIGQFVSATICKNIVRAYLVDKSKEEEICNLIDKCYENEKDNFCMCYTSGLLPLCPETKVAIENYKKEYPALFSN